MQLTHMQFQFISLIVSIVPACLGTKGLEKRQATSIPSWAFGDKTSQSTISADDRDGILNMHNSLRDLYGSAPHLQWDDALANDAQAWADQCTNSHSPTYFGESLASGAYNGCWNAIAWPQLEEDTYSTVSAADASWEAGHLSQMIWKNTQYLGCGMKTCDNGIGNYLVCHYWPPGNNGNTAASNLSPREAGKGPWYLSGWSGCPV